MASDRRRLAEEATRAARPGGVIDLRVFSSEDFRSTSGTEKEAGTRVRGNGILTHYFSEAEVAELFSSCVPERLETIRWSLRVRGKCLVRAEIEASFRTPDPNGSGSRGFCPR
jgi:hypothetical protein